MNKNGMWIPLIASVGVGAATYYTLSKKNQTIGETMEKVLPFVSEMSNGDSTSQNQMSSQNLS